MKVRLIRHATVLIEIHHLNILVDPMFSPAQLLDPAANSENELRNPLVELPVHPSELIDVDAILITHTHRDHFDDAAISLLPKNIKVFCQPQDAEKIRSCGFQDVQPIEDSAAWNGILIKRTGAQHGTLEIGKKMGPVSGFVLQAEQEPTLYLTGDTVWCDEVEKALQNFKPDVVLANAGAAQFLTGGPITLTCQDIEQICMSAKDSQIVAVHLESWNHCLLKRSELKGYLKYKNLLDRVLIPENGETLEFASQK